jgi:hypothetical protein
VITCVTAPEHFQVSDGYAAFRPTGEVTLSQGVALVTVAIKFARAQKIPRLLVDVTRLTGFQPPDLIARYDMAKEWAEAGQSGLRFVMVAPAKLIDPQRFGVVVARNRGLDANIFASEEEALRWLLDAPAK